MTEICRIKRVRYQWSICDKCKSDPDFSLERALPATTNDQCAKCQQFPPSHRSLAPTTCLQPTLRSATLV